MLIKFYCPGKDCSNKELKPYLPKVSSAERLDNRIAEFFCPLCRRKLIRHIRIRNPESYGDVPKRDLSRQG